MTMAEPLSKQLAELSVRAKNVEDTVAAAEKEARDKFEVRREQAHATATAATEKVNQQVKTLKDTTNRNWNALQAKIAADIDALKAGIAERKQERDVRRTENYAERLEWEAGFAIDYAVASIEQAKLAVLDAIAGRVQAEETRRAG
jgi:vacuolar-type H+-ATPase subunit I/STV1